MTSIDRLDVLIVTGLGFVCYGVAVIYSLAAAAIVVGGVLLVVAVIGVLWQMRRTVRRPQ